MTKMIGSYLGGLGVAYTHEQSGATLVTDAPTDNGGRGQAFSPTDLVATALGGCAMTIMAKQGDVVGVDLTGTTFEVTKTMAANPRRIARIDVTFTFPQGEYSDKVKKQIERAAHTCPVHVTLGDNVEQGMNFVWPAQDQPAGDGADA